MIKNNILIKNNLFKLYGYPANWDQKNPKNLEKG